MSGSHDHSGSEYVWRFKLTDDDRESLHPDALTEMVRQELMALLGCVVLTGDGLDLKVTGFRFLGEPSTEHAIYPGLSERRPRAETEPGSGGGDDASSA